MAHSHAYYGNGGKRAAVRAFFGHLLHVNKPCPILITSDESLNWLTESPSYSAEICDDIMQLINAGYTFRRISSKFWDTDEAVDSLNRWLPVYMHGKLETWYYPRIRDNIYRRTIIAAPGIAAICSSSVGYHVDSRLTFLNVDADMANAAAEEFNDYLAKCLPLTKVHMHYDGDESICDCLGRFLKVPGNRSTKYLGLPSLITPPSILHRAFADNKAAIETFVTFSKAYEQTLRQFKRTDIIVLEDPQKIRSGEVVCTASLLVPDTKPCYYTPAEYVEHLQTLLRLMETYPDYSVAVIGSTSPGISICSIDGGICYIIRSESPMTLFEISEQNFVAAANDYALSLSGVNPEMNTAQRKKTMDCIHNLIDELSSH